eukprot:7929392-Pyramimonas_sp.AAC.1
MAKRWALRVTAAQETSRPRACEAGDTAVPRVERSHSTGRPGAILGFGSRAQVSPVCARKRAIKCSSTVAEGSPCSSRVAKQSSRVAQAQPA